MPLKKSSQTATNVFAFGKKSGVDLTVLRLKKVLNFKVAGYYRSTYNLKFVDWLLDPITVDAKKNHNSTKLLDAKLGRANLEAVGSLIEALADAQPELLIVDGEETIAKIANKLDCDWIYLSPEHLLDGLKIKGEYKHLLFQRYMDVCYDWPKGNRIIYSAIGNFDNHISSNYEWITPEWIREELGDKVYDCVFLLDDPSRAAFFTKLAECLNLKIAVGLPYDASSKYVDTFNIFSDFSQFIGKTDVIFCFGSNSLLTDALMNEKKILISPKMSDYESLINAQTVQELGFGLEVGQLEFLGSLALDEFKRAFRKLPEPKKVKNLNPGILQVV